MNSVNNVKAGHKNKQSYANTRTTGKEQYYTNSEVVDLCIAEVQKHIDLSDKVILEPAGGTGEFIEGLKRIGIADKSIISYDIEPYHPLVKEGNYLETDLSSFNNLISITNPPFGRASSLAKKFFNHATGHSSYICYLVPKAWRKWSVHNSLDKNFHLIADIDMPKNCFYLSGGKTNKKDVLSTVFQIWEKRDYKRPKIEIPDHDLVKKIQPVKKTVLDKNNKEVKRPDYVTGANFEMIVFGHSCGKWKDLDETKRYDAKTTTMYFKIERQDVINTMKEVDFSHFFNNVSYVQALSLQEINYELNEWFGLGNFKFPRQQFS
jgi:predicted RNA methylase